MRHRFVVKSRNRIELCDEKCLIIHYSFKAFYLWLCIFNIRLYFIPNIAHTINHNIAYIRILGRFFFCVIARTLSLAGGRALSLSLSLSILVACNATVIPPMIATVHDKKSHLIVATCLMYHDSCVCIFRLISMYKLFFNFVSPN